MIVATNSSFNAANNKQLKKLVAMLKPGAIIPDRRNIGGNLLDEIYEEEQAKVKHLISGMSATIAIDGWSTITNQPIIGICIYAAGNCYLVDTIDTTGDSHTTEFLVDLLLHQIEEIQEKWEVNITSVVSDNAANMAAMRTRIKELDQKLHTYGCHAHIANLLVPRSICDTFRETQEDGNKSSGTCSQSVGSQVYRERTLSAWSTGSYGIYWRNGRTLSCWDIEVNCTRSAVRGKLVQGSIQRA